jgi:glycosyltransferase involved in cell wall biosynthesis
MTNRVAAKPLWVVAHCGARDQYQLPIALHESGQLHRFVTDWYSPMDNPMLRAVLKWAPQRLRSNLAKRYRGELPSGLATDVKLMGILKAVVGTDVLNFKLNRFVGECAARVASDSDSHLLITSYYGWAAFPELPKHIKKVLFQIHPHPLFLRDLYRTQESEQGVSFQRESEMRVEENFLKCWGRESLDADVVIAASCFTRQSLLCAGVKAGKIHLVPYGVDSLIFRNDVATPSGTPKVLFVGQPTARKGFQGLLRAWERIGSHGAELHIVCGITPQSHEVHSGGPVVWHGRLALTDLVRLMNRCDLLVLPSIAEGYGHVLLQSLSCGTPILCSDATAGPDLLIGWEEGFIFPSGDWNELSTRLDFWLRNVNRLRSLRGAARKLAESLPWERFRQGVRNACNSVIQPELDS